MAKFNMIIQAKTLGQAGIKRMGNSMQGLQGRLKNVRMAALSVNTAFRAMAVILTAGAVTRFAKGAIDQADAFGKLSRQTGIAAGTLQSYVNAGKLAGVEQTTIEKSLRRLAQSMREADQGISTYSDAYEALGVKVRDADGNLKTSQQVLGEMADEFRQMENGATKAALAMEIFGRSGSQIIPMLNEGSEALLKWNYQTSEEFSQNAEYFNDQLTMLGFGFDGFRKLLADALLPTLNNLIQVFHEMFASTNDWTALFQVIEGGLKVITSAVFTTVAGFRFLGKTIASIGKSLGSLAKGDFMGAWEAMQEGLRETRKDFQNDMKTFEKIWKGRANAPKEYFEEGTKAAKELAGQLGQTFGDAVKGKIDAFAKSLGSIGSQIGDVVVKAFKGMEDALVNFVTKGKASFSDFARSIIADMARIAIRQAIIGPLLSGFQNLFPTPAPTVTKAAGGYVSGPTNALIGEAGGEYVIPENQMDSALARYQGGARGDSVLQEGGDLVEAGGMVATAAPIDVRFNSEVINEVSYVTFDQFTEGIRQAAAQGAKQGEQATLRKLQTSSSTRRMVGV